MRNINLRILTLILNAIVFLWEPFYGWSQNEPYLGGSGDGFAYVNSSLFNMSDIEFEGNLLTVTINQAINQADPTNEESILFTVIFSEIVTDFSATDILVIGNTNPQQINISGSGTTYTVSLSGILNNGDVILQIPAGGIHNSVGRPNQQSTSTDNSVTFSGADLLVLIDLAPGQKELSNVETVNFSAVFSSPVIDFDASDINFSGSANPTSVSISGSESSYNIAVSGMNTNGNITIDIPEDKVHNNYGKGNNPSNNINNTVNVDYTSPSVEITQEAGQTDPTMTIPLNFHVEFSEDILGFIPDRITFGGSSGIAIQVTGEGKSYTVSATGVKTNETVSIFIAPYSVQDAAGNYNSGSLNIDNSITYTGTTSFNNLDKDDDVNIYYSNGNLYVNFNNIPEKKSSISIYDINGRLISVVRNLDIVNSIPLSINNSYYLIKVNNDNKINNKIIVPFN